MVTTVLERAVLGPADERAESPADEQAGTEILRRFGFLDEDSPAPQALPSRPARLATLKQRLWMPESAMILTKALVGLVRYPVRTLVIRAQFANTSVGFGSLGHQSTWQRLAKGAWLGSIYRWSSGYHLSGIGAILSIIYPGESRTVLAMLANITLHYLTYGAFYGLFRQSLVVRIYADSPSPPGLWRPGLGWIRDRVMLRGPRGAVLCAYLRDVLGNLAQGVAAYYLTRLVTSPAVVSAYFSVAGLTRSAKASIAHALRRIGLPVWKTRRRRHGVIGASAVFDDAVEVVFEEPARSPVPLQEQSPEIAQTKLCLYPRTISLMLAEILSCAVLFPVDTVIIRLMGDEAGLTRFGYSGFFSCLVGECRRAGVASLFSGFAGALVSELAIAWAGAELAHYLCKSTWRAE